MALFEIDESIVQSAEMICNYEMTIVHRGQKLIAAHNDVMVISL